MIQIRHERFADFDAREALLDAAFGESRYRKSSERLREDRLPAEGLSFIASEGKRVIGTARLWDIAVGNGRSALLLGPVAVAEDCRSRGLGGALVRRAIQTARKLGHGAVILVGDPEYYNRFGFSGEKTGALWMPGPFERHRLLGRELKAGGLDGARGMIAPAGRLEPTPDLAALVAQASRAHAPRGHRSRAA
ncbi:MAG: N-acetyltransferase [Hyphomicrobiales bacterium]|nr:N-acetyltransferase [Hyphomicrobiales bacterium]